MEWIAILILVALVCTVGAGIYLLATRKRVPGGPGPRCGKCEYNLTGCTSNRCPECGYLFIEAGVVLHSEHRSSRRKTIGVLLLGSSVLLTLFLVSSAYMMARAQQARAIAAQQRAIAAQQQAMLQAQRAQAEAATAAAQEAAARREETEDSRQ